MFMTKVTACDIVRKAHRRGLVLVADYIDFGGVRHWGVRSASSSQLCLDKLSMPAEWLSGSAR